jgi:hypothetical protein
MQSIDQYSLRIFPDSGSEWMKRIESKDVKDVRLFGCRKQIVSKVLESAIPGLKLSFIGCAMPSELLVATEGVDLRIRHSSGKFALQVLAEVSLLLEHSQCDELNFDGTGSLLALGIRDDSNQIEKVLSSLDRTRRLTKLVASLPGASYGQSILTAIKSSIPNQLLKIDGKLTEFYSLNSLSGDECSEIDLGSFFWFSAEAQESFLQNLPRCYTLHLPSLFLNDQFAEFLERNDQVNCLYIRSLWHQVASVSATSNFEGEISVQHASHAQLKLLTKFFPHAEVGCGPGVDGSGCNFTAW